MEFTSISTLPEKSQRDLPRVVNRILGQVFLYQDKDEDKDDYYFIHRHREACETAIELAGYNLDRTDAAIKLTLIWKSLKFDDLVNEQS